MRWIPSGTVRLGTDNVNNEFPEESPATRVRISKGFWIGQYEITQAQLENMLEVNPSEFYEDSDYPADSISWARAKSFAKRRTILKVRQVAFRKLVLQPAYRSTMAISCWGWNSTTLSDLLVCKQ